MILFWIAFDYSWHSVRNTLDDEITFLIKLADVVISPPVALLFLVSLIFIILLIWVVHLVLIIELLNTVVEALVNMISSEQHILTANAKDAVSAAGFNGFQSLLVVWGIILFDLIFSIS